MRGLTARQKDISRLLREKRSLYPDKIKIHRATILKRRRYSRA